MPHSARLAAAGWVAVALLCAGVGGARAAVIPPQVSPASVVAAPQRPPASVEDSLAAQRKAWFAMREMNWRSGTREFRAQKAVAGRTAIAEALRIVPGDEWLNSFRLRYPLPGSPPATSPASRAACGASPWWCDLLYMLSLYRGGNYPLADSVLTRAVARMPTNVRCVWDDVAPLLAETRTRRAYERMACVDRIPMEETIWWLADPFHTTPGNERRVEQYAREINMRLSQEAGLISIPGPAWTLSELRRATPLMHGVDIDPTVLPTESQPDSGVAPHRRNEGFLNRVDDSYGKANMMAWSPSRSDYTFWEVMDTLLRKGNIGRPQAGVALVNYSFVPAVAALKNPFGAEPSHWKLAANTWYERAFSRVGVIVDLTYQFAFFPRGDSVRFVIATDFRDTPFLRNTLNRTALAISRSPTVDPRVLRLPSAQRYTFDALESRDSMLVSLETIALSKGAGRARFGVAPRALTASRLQISDIAVADSVAAILSAAVGGKATLESIMPHIRGSTRIPLGSSVALYWEVYGLRAGEQPQISLIVTPESSGGILGAVNVFRGAQPEISTTYTDAAATGEGIEGRVLGVSLSTLRAGSYTLTIRVEIPGETPAQSERRIEVVRR